MMRLNRNHHVKMLTQPLNGRREAPPAAPLNHHMNSALNQFVRKALMVHPRSSR